MKILYVGHYNPGSTSRMRGEYLKELLPVTDFTLVNIDIPLSGTIRIFRSLGWRYKIGPLISNINSYVLEVLKGDFNYDLVWIDKGVFIEPDIIRKLKENSRRLVHFTPDPAFTYHRSKLFYASLSQYDYCITTKSFEIDNYRQYGVKTIFCTQGYDPRVHRPYVNFEDKAGVVFIGHKEEEREYVVSKLLEAGIPVTIAGNHWAGFANRRKNKSMLTYKGVGVFGDQYAKLISGAKMGLGFLSKWIPELHTTRTFEIPACGTALVTEKNDEIGAIFSEQEAIYYSDPAEVTERVLYYMANPDELKLISENGYHKVVEGGYSYRELLQKIISQMDLVKFVS